MDDLWRYAEMLGCQMGAFPILYLGLSLEALYKCKKVKNPLSERIHKRLAGWKGTCLSKGGELSLLKLVLSSLPTYFLSLLVIRSSVAYEIDKSQRKFLWDQWKEIKGMHLANWKEVCPKEVGGLEARKNLGSFQDGKPKLLETPMVWAVGKLLWTNWSILKMDFVLRLALRSIPAFGKIVGALQDC